MRLSRNRLVGLAVTAALALPGAASAEMIGGNPGPQYNYVCPHADGQGALDCYFDAVEHLYTMCRNVKSIEIIEFGYEDSQEGINAAKFESCVDKQKLNMAKPYQAALKEARISKQAAEGVQSLHEFWLAAMQHIRWNRPESDEQYKDRVNVRAYQDFHDKIAGIRTIVTLVKERTAAPVAARAKGAPKTPAKAASQPSKMTPAAKSAGGTPGGTPASDKAPRS
jgi:hypothetical protein